VFLRFTEAMNDVVRLSMVHCILLCYVDMEIGNGYDNDAMSAYTRGYEMAAAALAAAQMQSSHGHPHTTNAAAASLAAHSQAIAAQYTHAAMMSHTAAATSTAAHMYGSTSKVVLITFVLCPFPLRSMRPSPPRLTLYGMLYYSGLPRFVVDGEVMQLCTPFGPCVRLVLGTLTRSHLLTHHSRSVIYFFLSFLSHGI
jgi:hypothetical protein